MRSYFIDNDLEGISIVAVDLIIIHFCPSEADLRIGEVQWGDSGVYICKVVISDDLSGLNEDSVELLVLGKL